MKLTFFIYFFIFSYFSFSQVVDTSLVQLERTLELASTTNTKVEALLALSEYELNHNFSKSRKLIYEAYTLIENNKEVNKYKGQALMQIGVLKRRLGKHEEALVYYLEALQLFESKNDLQNKADAYHNIGMVYRSQHDYPKSINYLEKAILLNDSLGNQLGVAHANNMIANSYYKAHKIEASFNSYKEAKRIFQSIGNKNNIQEVNDNLVSFYRNQGNLEKALNLSLSNIKYSKSKGKLLALSGNYYSTSLIYYNLKEYRIAGKYVDSSLKIAKREGFVHKIVKTYKKRSQIWSKLGNYKSAYRDYKRYKKYADSIYNIETIQNIKTLEMNHVFDKERQQIKLLTKEETFRKRLYFILFLLTLLSGIVIAFLYRKNNRNRIQLFKERYKNEKLLLEQQVKHKDADVKALIADNSMRLAYNKEWLVRIKQITDSNSDSIEQLLKDLRLDLQLQIGTEEKLTNLQEKITSVNNEFVSLLKIKYPTLTKGELEVSALLRLNLSIKEIMTIRNVSEDSVKSMRRRIRKKMLIPKGSSLEDFIQKLL